jgi:hypothetical protein
VYDAYSKWWEVESGEINTKYNGHEEWRVSLEGEYPTTASDSQLAAKAGVSNSCRKSAEPLGGSLHNKIHHSPSRHRDCCTSHCSPSGSGVREITITPALVLKPNT